MKAHNACSHLSRITSVLTSGMRDKDFKKILYHKSGDLNAFLKIHHKSYISIHAIHVQCTSIACIDGVVFFVGNEKMDGMRNSQERLNIDFRVSRK